MYKNFQIIVLPSANGGFCPDTYFFEVCYFNQVCANRDGLWRLGVGESFFCDFDVDKYRELGTLLS